LLSRRQFFVEDDDVGSRVRAQRDQFFYLAGADERCRIDAFDALF